MAQQKLGSKTIEFPMKMLDAVKFSLMNSSFFHPLFLDDGQAFGDRHIHALLKEDGDFLIQDSKDVKLHLYVRVYGDILELPITIDHQGHGHSHGTFCFLFCEQRFDSLEKLVMHFSTKEDGCTNFIQTKAGDQFQLVRPVFRQKYAGRLGYGECMEVHDCVHRNKLRPSFVRVLRADIATSAELEEDLERLCALDHPNLIRVCDFFLLHARSSSAASPSSPLVFVRFDQIPSAKSLLDRLFNQQSGVLSKRTYIRWAYQAAKGLAYLLDRGILHRRLHARACLLDSGDNLRLSDFWTDQQEQGDSPQRFQQDAHLPRNIRQSALTYRDEWRYLPVETLTNGRFDSTSQVWTYALLVWQIYTHCQFGNRIFYPSLAEFLNVTAGQDAPYHMPGHLTLQEAQQGMPEQRRRKMLFLKASEELPHMPDSLAQIVPKALAPVRSERPYFSEMFRCVEGEKRILDAAHVIGYFL